MIFHTLFAQFAAMGSNCTPNGGGLLGFPTWYKYLKGIRDAENICVPSVVGINDVWFIAMAAIEILLRVAALLAFFMIIYAAFSYVTSQGEPDATAKAKGTLINAILGLAISVSAVLIVNFIARSITV